jgi:hypothetical protein
MSPLPKSSVDIAGRQFDQWTEYLGELCSLFSISRRGLFDMDDPRSATCMGTRCCSFGGWFARYTLYRPTSADHSPRHTNINADMEISDGILVSLKQDQDKGLFDLSRQRSEVSYFDFDNYISSKHR